MKLFQRAAQGERYALRHDWPTHHNGSVAFLEVHGPLIVTAGLDGKVCVPRWNGDRPSCLRSVRVPVTALWANDRSVVWGGEDGYVSWGQPLTQAQKVRKWRVGPEVVALAVRPREDEQPPVIVVATSRGQVLQLPAEPNHPLTSLPTGDDWGSILALRWLDEESVAVAMKNRVAICTQGKNGRPYPPLRDSEKLSAFGCPERKRERGTGGPWIAWGTETGHLWAVNTQSPVAPKLLCPPVHRDEVVAVRFIGEDVVLSASRDGTVKFVQLGTGEHRLLGGFPFGKKVTALAVEGTEVLAGLADGSVVSLCLHLPRGSEGPAHGEVVCARGPDTGAGRAWPFTSLPLNTRGWSRGTWSAGRPAQRRSGDAARTPLRSSSSGWAPTCPRRSCSRG